MGVRSFKHIGGAAPDTTQLSGNIRGNSSGDGLGNSENQSWNAQYRYMVLFADKIEYISKHLLDAKYDLYYSKRILSELIGLWAIFLGSPKGSEMGAEKKRKIGLRINTAEAYLIIGDTDREVEIIKEVYVEILNPLGNGYTFKGSRAKVKIRSGISGDMDDLVGRS